MKPGESAVMTAPRKTLHYLGYEYRESQAKVPPREKLGYTGWEHEGKKVYADIDGPIKHEGLIEHLFVKVGDGRYSSFTLTGLPSASVYTYMLCGTFNPFESVLFGIVNGLPVPIRISYALHYHIDSADASGDWHVAYRIPPIVYVIPPPDKIIERSAMWEWDQLVNMDSEGRFTHNMIHSGDGIYRVGFPQVLYEGRGGKTNSVLPEPQYFSVDSSVAGVDAGNEEYDKQSADDEFLRGICKYAFDTVIKYSQQKVSLDNTSPEDFRGQMLLKAHLKGLSSRSLKSAIDVMGDSSGDSLQVPYYAKHATYRGIPAWFIRCLVRTDRPRKICSACLYVIEDNTGKVLYYNRLKS